MKKLKKNQKIMGIRNQKPKEEILKELKELQEMTGDKVFPLSKATVVDTSESGTIVEPKKEGEIQST